VPAHRLFFLFVSTVVPLFASFCAPRAAYLTPFSTSRASFLAPFCAARAPFLAPFGTRLRRLSRRSGGRGGCLGVSV
jgi:hypothetical protein